MYNTLMAMAFGNMGIMLWLYQKLRFHEATWATTLPLICFIIAAYYGFRGLKNDDSALGLLPFMIGTFAALYSFSLVLRWIFGPGIIKAGARAILDFLTGLRESLT